MTRNDTSPLMALHILIGRQIIESTASANTTLPLRWAGFESADNPMRKERPGVTAIGALILEMAALQPTLQAKIQDFLAVQGMRKEDFTSSYQQDRNPNSGETKLQHHIGAQIVQSTAAVDDYALPLSVGDFAGDENAIASLGSLIVAAAKRSPLITNQVINFLEPHGDHHLQTFRDILQPPVAGDFRVGKLGLNLQL